jgi:UDP-N-acetyl-D-glucosamine dehydrogenase
VRTQIENRILDRSAVLAVIGLGYVGLPLAVGFARTGYRVIGVDLDLAKIDVLTSGHSTIDDIADDDLRPLVESGTFHPVASYEGVGAADVVFICVPTPFTAMKAPDLSFVENATLSVAGHLRRGQLVILQSTTYPGTTEEVVLPLLEATGLKVGQDFFLAFSPERIDPGHTSSAGFTVENTPKVVGGVTPDCVRPAALLLSQMIASVYEVSSPRAAEMTKLLENTFRSVNIALVNELAILAERMDIDIWEVIDAAKSKPYGFMPFYPGPGVGGHCIPVDPFYLSWKAREFDYYTKFIELAAEVNSEMAAHAFEKITHALNRTGTALRGAVVLVLGVAFKANVDDARNSPAEPIIEMLLKTGATVRYHDPFVDTFRVGGDFHFRPSVEFTSQALTSANLAAADCVVIITRHTVFDIEMIVEHSRVIVDTVNATGSVESGRDKVIRLGAPESHQDWSVADPDLSSDVATDIEAIAGD